MKIKTDGYHRIIYKILFVFFRGIFEKKKLNDEMNYYRFLCKKNINPKSLRSNIQYQPNAGANTYIDLHDQKGYKNNNWGLGLLHEEKLKNCNSFFELGSGNGMLIELGISQSKKMRGIDLINPTNNLNIITNSIDSLDYKQLDEYDVTVSADFLEHLPVSVLFKVIDNISKGKSKQFHIKACYDDYISHETILTPGEWLYLFKNIDPSFKIERIEYRRPITEKMCVEITNL
jgi:hypothetical protein